MHFIFFYIYIGISGKCNMSSFNSCVQWLGFGSSDFNLPDPYPDPIQLLIYSKIA